MFLWVWWFVCIGAGWVIGVWELAELDLLVPLAPFFARYVSAVPVRQVLIVWVIFHEGSVEESFPRAPNLCECLVEVSDLLLHGVPFGSEPGFYLGTVVLEEVGTHFCVCSL